MSKTEIFAADFETTTDPEKTEVWAWGISNLDCMSPFECGTNIQSFIESLPISYATKIGDEGLGLSQGQKQRLLIARAIYKNPNIILFDEATNALDAYNEMIIMDNLNDFLVQKTVVIVAHRLSTVIHADKIIVLEDGEIIEEGNHQNLIQSKGAYYHLIKNQLELGQ